MSILGFTGQPWISNAAGTLTLPYPDYASWMQGYQDDESRWVYGLGGQARLAGVARNRARYQFGYRALDVRMSEADIRTLVDILGLRVVSFIPRTAADPSEGSPDTLSCLVVSPIRVTKHLKSGMVLDIALQSMV